MRVFIADEQPKVRFALGVLLARKAGCEIVGQTGNAEELLAHVKVAQPDVVFLGWELPGLDETCSLAILREICPEVVVIALSGWPEARQAALKAGADLFVSKADPPERLLEAIGCCKCG